MKDTIDQSTPANVLSRVAKKLDENGIELKNNRDYLTAPNTFKYQNDDVNKSSKYKYYSTQQNPSNQSDIYIKLSDCQAAGRLVNILLHQTNSTNYLIDVGLLNIINKINQICFLHIFILIIERKKIDIEKQKYLYVIGIFLCL
jgi:hypothetical protein